MVSDQHANDASLLSSGAADWQSGTADGRASRLLTGRSTAPVTSSGLGRDAIAVIDRRALGRDVLTRSVELAGGCRSITAFSNIDEWLIDGSAHETSAVLLGVGDADSDDPEVAGDLRRLAECHPDIPVIVIGDRDDAAQVVAILSQGASGYIPTSMGLSAAVGAISLVIAGGVFVPASALLDIGNPDTRRSAPSETRFGLTERQGAIADRIAQGKPNKIIAYELNLSEGTVKVHVRTIMRKLKARNRTEVAFKLHAVQRRPAARTF
ncbi:response regulator transcription factor [Inquilinus sp. Marseille-Q2685]|uniref:response regulator transcription factor n=1 Tax=Inquilinus sp. Marseille-Q2685 TaxID=2866581 RepID=UPI001CE40AFE|nr:response regulator transcription factor [Inquilinus sp. Marseille-Q2685]